MEHEYACMSNASNFSACTPSNMPMRYTQAIVRIPTHKKVLLAYECAIFSLSQDCAQEMISQAGAMGVHLGANTKINLKIAMEEREAHEALTASPSTAVDIKVCGCLRVWVLAREWVRNCVYS